MTREEIIEGLLGIHAVTANYKGDQVILHNMPMPKLTGILYGAAELLKAQEPHVVTLADYENNPNVDKDGNLAVWRESRHFNGIAYHEDGWVVLNRERVEGWFNSEVIRFWTSRPTPEQRWQNT